MIDYFNGEMVSMNNLTPAVANNALRGLGQIHSVGVRHGDIYDTSCSFLRNVMVSKGGEVKWIDFEHSCLDTNGEHMKLEYMLAYRLWGPDGQVWKEYVCFLYCTTYTDVR
jgi:hypothetical protein